MVVQLLKTKQKNTPKKKEENRKDRIGDKGEGVLCKGKWLCFSGKSNSAHHHSWSLTTACENKRRKASGLYNLPLVFFLLQFFNFGCWQHSYAQNLPQSWMWCQGVSHKLWAVALIICVKHTTNNNKKSPPFPPKKTTTHTHKQTNKQKHKHARAHFFPALFPDWSISHWPLFFPSSLICEIISQKLRWELVIQSVIRFLCLKCGVSFSACVRIILQFHN